MNNLKKVCLLLITLFILSSTKVYAATASISASTNNAYVGDNVTINVNVYAGSWNLNVTGSVSANIVGYDEDKNTTTTRSYNLDTSRAGTYTVTLSGDITDYDTEVTTYPNQSVTVTISERPQTPATTPTPSNNNQSNNFNSSFNNNSNKSNNTKTNPNQETKPEETVEAIIEEKVNITKFDIVGYRLDFSSEVHEYSIDVKDGLTDLYIIVEGEDITVNNAGKVNISGLDEITVSVTHKEKTYDYKIKIFRINPNEFLKAAASAIPIDNGGWSNREKLLLSTTLVFEATTLVFLTSMINKKRKKRRRKIKKVAE